MKMIPAQTTEGSGFKIIFGAHSEGFKPSALIKVGEWWFSAAEISMGHSQSMIEAMMELGLNRLSLLPDFLERFGVNLENLARDNAADTLDRVTKFCNRAVADCEETVNCEYLIGIINGLLGQDIKAYRQLEAQLEGALERIEAIKAGSR